MVTRVPATSIPSDGSQTDDGPLNAGSSDEEPVKMPAKRRQRAARSEPARGGGGGGVSPDDKPPALRKPSRAKSQPPSSSRSRPPGGRYDWAERRPDTPGRRSAHQTSAPAASAPARREADKRASNPERRRARSADLEKTRRSQLSVADDRWTTEYMRCFSARLR